MFELVSQSDPMFIGMLTLILIAMLVVFIKSFKCKGDKGQLDVAIQWIKSIGTLGLVLGIFGQLLGMYSAFTVIEAAPGISPSVLAGGLKVSLITTLYGMLIYIIYLIFSMILRRLY